MKARSLSEVRSLLEHQPTATVPSTLSIIRHLTGYVTYILPKKRQSIDKERSITLRVNEAKFYSKFVTLNVDMAVDGNHVQNFIMVYLKVGYVSCLSSFLLISITSTI